MGMGGVIREIFPRVKGATVWSCSPEVTQSVQPFHFDNRLESTWNGGNSQPSWQRWGGAPGVLCLALMQSSGAKLLFLRRGVLGRGVGNQPLSVLPFWKLLEFGDRSRAPEMAYDNAEADG